MNYPLLGILLFTESDPHMIKVLRDPDYYAALDNITGKNLALFATILFQGKYEYPSLPPGVLAHMVPIWREPRQNKKVTPWFSISDSRELPLLVIFGHKSGDFYYQKYPIKAETPETIFNNLKEVLLRISTSVQKARDEGGVNKQIMFEHAQWEMKKLEAHQNIKGFLETVSMFRGAIGV